MPHTDLDLTNFINYCESLAGEFSKRRNRIQSFVKHNSTSGTANEAILRDFFADTSAGIYKVSQGFVCNPIRSTSSKQCDILIYDQRFPLVHSEGDVKIVWPESVLMVIEVKTNMSSKKDLEGAIKNIISVKETESVRRLSGLIFSFGSLRPETVLEVLNSYLGEKSHRPIAVILFDEGAFIHQKDVSDWLHGGGSSDYELRWCKGEDTSALALAYLLLKFLQMQMKYAPAPGFSAFNDLSEAAKEFLKEKTTLSKSEVRG